MLDIVLTIVLFNLLLIIFKVMAKYNVDNLQVIVVNYFVAGFCGLFMYWNQHHDLPLDSMGTSSGLIHATAIGLFFISVFNALALATQKVGMALPTIANKMSLIVPILLAFFYYQEPVSWLKVVGIIMALAGIYLSSVSGGKLSVSGKTLWLIVFIFCRTRYCR